MLVSVQYLRAIAASMVVYHHISLQVPKLHDLNLPFGHLGAAGVDIFFVISGFLIWVTTYQKPMSVATFIGKRVRRIVPLYWAVTSFVVAVMLVAPSVLSSSTFDFNHALASYFFVPHRHPIITEQFWPVIIPGWTLNYEMFFYGLFALAMFAPDAKRLWVICGLLFAIAILPMVANISDGPLLFYTRPVILEFVAGVLIGAIYTKYGLMRDNWLAFVSVAVGLLIFLINAGTDESARAWTWGVGATFIAAGLISLEPVIKNATSRTMVLVGDASYAIYLTHILVLPVMAKAFAMLGPSRHWSIDLFAVSLTFVIATLVGIAAYLFVEKPLLRAFTPKSQRRQPA